MSSSVIETTVGVVQAKSKWGKSFKLLGDKEDRWYSTFTAGELAEVEPGAEVKFSFVRTEKTPGKVYWNIRGPVVVVSKAEPKKYEGTSVAMSRTGFPVVGDDRERSVIRRHAVSAAIEYCTQVTGGDPSTLDISTVLEFAKQIEYYTSGDDVAAEIAKALREEETTTGEL